MDLPIEFGGEASEMQRRATECNEMHGFSTHLRARYYPD
jgi:hypothetical protein